jgi:hypothetical protein
LVLLLTHVLAATAAPLPSATDYVADVTSGGINPETYDLTAYWQLPQQERGAWYTAVIQPLTAPRPGVSGCDPESQRRFAGALWLVVLIQSADAADWQRNAKALRDNLAKLDAKLAEAAAAAPQGDARTRELLGRYARDQRVRKVYMEPEWTQGLPPAAANNWMAMLATRMGAVDCDNTAWLRAQVARVGWFDIPAYGAAADSAAWHLVQHADLTPEFQREMLPKLHALPKGHTDAKRIAYLHDRVARAQGEPQRYGTQGQCGPDGIWKPFDSEDPEHLDDRRKELGMDSISDHARVVSREACPKT